MGIGRAGQSPPENENRRAVFSPGKLLKACIRICNTEARLESIVEQNEHSLPLFSRVRACRTKNWLPA